MSKKKTKLIIDSEEEENNSIEPNISAESKHKKFIKLCDRLMTLIGVGGQTLFYLQSYKIYMVGSAKDVSLPGFCFALFSLICWFLYGLLIKNNALILVNGFAVIGALLTVLAIISVS